MRNWRLRTKLAAILVIPLLLIGTLVSVRVEASVQDARDLDALVGQVAAGQQVARLVDELQQERVLAETYVARNRTNGRVDLDTQVNRVDADIAAVATLPPAQFGPAADDIEAAARVRLGDMAALRRAVTGSSFPAERVGAAYTSIIDVLLALESAALTAAPAPLLREAADAVIVATAKEQVRRQQATLAAVLGGGSTTTALQEAARSADAQLAATLVELDTSAQQSTRDRFASTVAGADVDNRQRIEQRALNAMARDEPLPAVAADWDLASDRTAGLIREVEVAQQRLLASDGAALAASARSAALRDTIVVALLVLLTVLMLVLVARSLVRPLRTLRTTAFQIARSRLPATIAAMAIVDGRTPDVRVKPIGVDTDEEIGEVARAFDAVHAAAVRLAGEQALLRRSVNDSFVSLARRSQGLVTRQLCLIDEMEQRERDSGQLGELFKIDHLATRMRRNSENLLVLAGDSGRKAQDAPDTSAEGVLGAAVSEIELYRMIVVGPAPDVVVRGGVVADLAHLVAELLENATTFSALDAPVSLDARTRSDGAMVVEIVDEGVGMTAARLAKINNELAQPPLFDAAVSRQMGLFVVGRLAQRHGIDVELRSKSAGGGLVASVLVPAALLVPLSPTTATTRESEALSGDGWVDRERMLSTLAGAGAVRGRPGRALLWRATAGLPDPRTAPDATGLDADRAPSP
jgi:signal transduction histidine kinase